MTGRVNHPSPRWGLLLSVLLAGPAWASAGDEQVSGPAAGVPSGSTVEYIMIERRSSEATRRQAPALAPPTVHPGAARGLPKQVSRRLAARRPPSVAAPAPQIARIGAIAGPGTRQQRPWLGDGSTSGELLAAARRLQGLHVQDDTRSFIQHLSMVSALGLKLGGSPDTHGAGARMELKTRGQIFAKAPPEPGDLAFLRAEERGVAVAVAVVEGVDTAGRVHLLLPVDGVVKRTPLAGVNDPRLLDFARP